MGTPTTWGSWSDVSLTGDPLVDALIGGTRWTSGSISYSFASPLSIWFTHGIYGYGSKGSLNEPWSPSMQGLYTEDRAAVRTALAAWASVANVTFTEVGESFTVVGDLRFAYTSGSYAGISGQAWAYQPSETARGGDVWFNTQGSSFTKPWALGTYEYQTVLHEIGHALGLKHSFQDSLANSATLPVQRESRSYTLMSYQAGAGVGFKDTYFSYEPTTPMILDIMAIQAIYGANTTHNSGNTTYSFASGPYHQTIWDAGGLDTVIDLSSLGSWIDLNEGAASQVGASVFVQSSSGIDIFEVNNLWIAFGTTIENATGGGGNDVLIGNAIGNVLIGGDGADRLQGGAGADTVDGGAGNDIAVYERSRNHYTVTFNVATSAFTVASVAEGTDSVENVESFEFGGIAFSAASLVHSIAGEAVKGGDGPDSLVGTPGNDTVNGGAGPDTYVFGGARSQYVLSSTGQGHLVQDTSPGRDGTDTLAAVEMLVFSDSTVDLTMGQKAAAISASDLQTLEELYVGFFNRIPEAAGLRYWIGQLESGVTLRSVADQFYSAGVQFDVFSEDMTEAEFITVIYANVLGRTGATAPNSQEIGYWQGWLHTGTHSKGAMVLEMLSNSHTGFTGHPEFGWVVDLLDNKAEVADYFAVRQGLSYTDPQTNIARGIEIAAAITPSDTAAAIALIGVNEFSM